MIHDEMLEPVIAAIREGTELSRFDILRELEGWDVHPGKIDGRHVATAITKGTEIHFAFVKDWRPSGSIRGRTREFLRPLLDRYGYLTTRLFHHQVKQRKFVERVGFKPTWHDENFQYFLLGRLPFERKQ